MEQHFDSSRKNPRKSPKIPEKLLSMTNKITYFWIGNIKLLKFSYFDDKTLMVFCKWTWWQDLNGLLQVPSRYLWFIWKRFFFLFSGSTQSYFMTILINLYCIRILYYGNNFSVCRIESVTKRRKTNK